MSEPNATPVEENWCDRIAEILSQDMDPEGTVFDVRDDTKPCIRNAVLELIGAAYPEAKLKKGTTPSSFPNSLRKTCR